jgi:ATP-dependent protease ClpP protease subunit
MLIHRGSGGNFGSYEQTESAQQNYKEEVDEIIASFKKRTNVPENVLREKMAPDWYLSANMALKYGIIDRIITDITEIL